MAGRDGWQDAPISTASDDNPAAARWRRLVTGRLEELRRLAPTSACAGGSFWDARAESYARRHPPEDAATDPFLRRLRRLTDASSTVVDAGSGTGRFALALAAGVRHVTAVDPSAAMLAAAQRDAGRLAVTNLTTIRATWEEADVAPADVAFSAFVVTLVPDAVPFLVKLDAAARRRVLLYLGAYSGDALLDPLWRHFHDAPRAPGPSYLDALAVVRELGIQPRVTVVELPNSRRFAAIDEAVGYYRDGLLLPDTPAVRRELEGLLADWLLGRRGALRSPLRTVPAAILEWTPGVCG